MLDERGEIAPFGWALACTGRKPNQVGEDVRALVQWSANTCRRYFPPEQGYQVDVESPAGAAHGVRMTVTRGDFRAAVAIEKGIEPRALTHNSPADLSVRMFGRAYSEAMCRAHRLGERIVLRCRAAGWAGGTSVFLSLAWLMIGVRDPVYVLGGMLLVVALLMTLLGGGTLGTWVGERVASLHRGRTLRSTNHDDALRDDIRRWKALTRQFTAQRNALTGVRQLPFRSEAS